MSHHKFDVKEKKEKGKDKKISLEKKIQETIDQDKNIGSYGLKVEVVNDVVRVNGIVDTLNEKEHIKELVKEIAGDKELDLAVSISTDGAIDDEDVSLEVAEELADRAGLENRVTARVEKGVVELHGNVENEKQKKEAVEAASKARGVTGIKNKIKVDGNKREDPEDIFHSQVRNDKED